jgi:hypothetical protein
MSVMDAIRKLGEHMGMEGDELDSLLSDDDWQPPEVDPLSEELAGSAAGTLEVFLADGGPLLQSKDDDLLWAPMIREGQWAVRPGPAGQKKKRPLRVVVGKSKDSRKEIGLQDLIDNFNDGAVEYVTVPETHDNKWVENTGFIRKMKLARAPIQTGPNKGKKAMTLFGGYHFTDKKAKQKASEGSVAGRSCGILYDYTNTETGKTYNSVVEHCCLTNKPWITGMIPFGRKLKGVVEGFSVEPMRLSDDEPPEEIFDDDEKLSEWVESLELATLDAPAATNDTWSQEESPEWLKQQVNNLLQEARMEKDKARRKDSVSYVYESTPYYRCREAKPGEALIADGYSDDANYWKAGIKVVDGTVEIDDFSTWVKLKKAYVPDPQRKSPDKKHEPLSEERIGELVTQVTEGTPYQRAIAVRTLVENDLDGRVPDTPRARKARAQLDRDQRLSTDNPDQETTPRGGEQDMAEGDGGAVHELSEDARRQIEELNAQLAEEKRRSERLSQRVDGLLSNTHQDRVGAILKRVEGIGLSAANGHGGFLQELETVLLEDDGEPAVVSEKFSAEGSTEEVGLSVTDAFERVFNALKLGEDGKVTLSDQLTEPAEGSDKEKPDGGDGKPPAEAGDETTKADDPRKTAEELARDNPELAAMTGLGRDNGKGGES